jgi:recombination protein RecA
VKPFDLTKLRKAITKNHNISDGFHDPEVWIDTGSYAINYLISSSFFKGVPLGKVSVFAGESGSGKSYIVSGNIAKNAQKQGILPIILDSEYALDKKWISDLGVNTDANQLIRYPVNLVDDCANIINEVMKNFIADHGSDDKKDQPKLLIIIDSLNNLSTPTDIIQFQNGDMKGNMGIKPKQLKALVTQALKLFGPYNIGLVATNHVYKSQDQFNPDDVISGGNGFIYAASIVVQQQKLKLKEDENGDKTTTVQGIRSKIKVYKSRYAKPFEEIEVQIPYDTGMNPYSGLFELFEKSSTFIKDGNSYVYTALDGSVVKQFKKAWKKDFDNLQLVMRETEIRDAKIDAERGVNMKMEDIPDLDEGTDGVE